MEWGQERAHRSISIRMRILVIGHTYVVAENQKKLEALAACPGVEVALVVPRQWRDPLHGTLKAHRPEGARFTLRALPTIGSGREQFHVYRSADLGLRHLQPDVVYVEQGAGAFVYAQALAVRNSFAPRAKAVFFTWWNLPYRARWPLSAVERFNLRHSQGAVTGNADAARIVREHGFDGPLLTLPQLGVDTATFAPRDATARRQALGLTRFTVGFVGRLVEEKGVRVLLEALADAAFAFDLLVVGGGPLLGELQAAARAIGWRGRLSVVDVVEHDTVPEYLACMDVLVLPSLTTPSWKEQFGHVLIEAMACGVPVVGSSSGDIPEVIGAAGVVVREGDAHALRAALTALVQSPERRRELSALGRARVSERFTHEQIAATLADFLRAL